MSHEGGHRKEEAQTYHEDTQELAGSPWIKASRGAPGPHRNTQLKLSVGGNDNVSE